MKLFALPVVGSVLILIAGLMFGGPGVLLTLAILGILEVSLSFDNAVINSIYLEKMNATWQKIFLTIGILIAVFGMRLLFPLVVVALAAHTSLGHALNLALHHPDEYKHFLAGAHDSIATFGAVFLGMIFLDFMCEEREVRWLGPIEKFMARVGKLDIAAVTIMLIVLAATARNSLFAGVLALALYLAVGMVSEHFEEDEEELELDHENAVELNIKSMKLANGMEASVDYAKVTPYKKAAKAGIGAFLYLELMDASFSFDGVMAAFAITTNIVLIALGLGIGALYIRTLTVFLVRKGVLGELVHLEHGAHYAIGGLATILFVSLYRDVPEWVSATFSVVVIGTSLLTSLVVKKRPTDQLSEGERTVESVPTTPERPLYQKAQDLRDI